MPIGRTCPKCLCFDVRRVAMGGDDLHGYQCHDCQHIFYISVDELQREAEDMRRARSLDSRRKRHRSAAVVSRPSFPPAPWPRLSAAP